MVLNTTSLKITTSQRERFIKQKTKNALNVAKRLKITTSQRERFISFSIQKKEEIKVDGLKITTSQRERFIGKIPMVVQFIFLSQNNYLSKREVYNSS